MVAVPTETSAERVDLAHCALAQMSQAVAIFDADLRLTYCNPAAVTLLKLAPELARPGTPFRGIIQHQAARGAVSQDEIPKLLRSVEVKPRHRLEYQTADGMTVLVRRDPLTVGGFVILYDDVTVQRRAETALQQNERRYHAIVEDQTDLIVRFTPGGRITFVNRAYCRFFGMPRVDILGRNSLDFVHPGDRISVGAYFEANGSRKRPRTIEHRALNAADGSTRLLHRSDRPIFNRQNELVEYQSVMRDVTELRRMQEFAHRANKLATLGQIVAGITHELNQPLNAAALAAQNALMDIEERAVVDVEYIKRKLTSLVESQRRMGAIVNHLRTFVRPAKDTSAQTDVLEVVRRSVDLVANQLNFDVIRFGMRLPPRCRPVAAAPVDLEMVLVNLFTNARDAITRRRAAERRFRGHIAITVKDEDPGPDVRIRVRDNGGGIAEDVLPQIFDPFFTTKEVGAGMGLGLSIVHQTVMNLGGKLNVHNVKEGAEFRIAIPVAAKS